MRRLLVVLGLLAFAADPALGETVEVGASGQCYDSAGNGGDDEARVSLDTADPLGARVTAPSGTGTAAAVAEFAQGLPDNACPNPRTFDYIEADASVGGTSAQVCFGQGLLRTDGSCPTSPSGL